MKYKYYENHFNKFSYDELSKYTTLFFLIIALYASTFIKFVIFPDTYTYLSSAKDISMGGRYDYPFQPPGFSFLISILGKYTGIDFFSAATAISIIFSTVFIYLVYHIIKNIFNDEKLAFFSQILVATNSVVFLFSILPLTDMMFTTLFYISIYFIIKTFDNPSNKYFLIAGIFGGLAYLTRYNALNLIIAILLLFIILKVDFKKLLILISLYYIGFFLTASPWLIINFLENGSPFHNHLYTVVAYNMYYGPQINEVLFNQISNQYNSYSEVILSNPKLFIFHWFEVGFFGFIIIIGFSIFLLISGLHRNKKLLFVFIVLCIYYLSVTMAHIEERYLIPFVPIAVAIFLYGFLNIQEIQEKFRLFSLFNSKIFQIKIKYIVLLCFIIFNIFSGVTIMRVIQQQSIEKEVGNFLIHYGSPLDVMVGDPKFVLYANMKNGGMPENLMNISNIDYIVYDEKSYADKAPQLKYLFDPTNKTIPPNFKINLLQI